MSAKKVWNSKPRKMIDGIMYYQCTSCKLFISFEDFVKNKNRKLGIDSVCKKCAAKRNADRLSDKTVVKRAKLKYTMFLSNLKKGKIA